MSKLQRTLISRGAAALAVASLLGAGCNDHPVGGGPAPEFRGITVPLPPPSYRSAPIIKARLSGESLGHEGGRATVWDLENSRGIVTPVAEDGYFAFEPWEINLREHCFELSASLNFEPESRATYYGLVLRGFDACKQPNCSVADAQGECVCIDALEAGCYDRPEWPDASSQAPSASGAGATSGEMP